MLLGHPAWSPSPHFTGVGGRRRPIRLIVLHTTESPEETGGARAVANYFARQGTKASAHYVVDSLDLVQCVHEDDIAWAAPGANRDGLQVELVGRAGQGAAGWGDAYSRAVLDRAARLVALLGVQRGIPAVRLSNADLRRGTTRGLVGHSQVSEVYRLSDHTDPGPAFPWPSFVKTVAQYRAQLS